MHHTRITKLVLVSGCFSIRPDGGASNAHQTGSLGAYPHFERGTPLSDQSKASVFAVFLLVLFSYYACFLTPVERRVGCLLLALRALSDALRKGRRESRRGTSPPPPPAPPLPLPAPPPALPPPPRPPPPPPMEWSHACRRKSNSPCTAMWPRNVNRERWGRLLMGVAGGAGGGGHGVHQAFVAVKCMYRSSYPAQSSGKSIFIKGLW